MATDWDNFLTTRYAPFANVVPDDDSVVADFPLVSTDERSGGDYVYPLQTTLSNGVTRTTSDDIVDLRTPISPQTLQAIVSVPAYFNSERFSQTIVDKSRAGVSEAGRAASYFDPIDFYVENCIKGLQNQFESDYMFGCGSGTTILDNIGVAYASGSATLGTVGSTVKLTAASWSEGNLNTLVGAHFDIYAANGSTLVEDDVTFEAVADASICQLRLFKAGSNKTISPGDQIVLNGAKGASIIGLNAQLVNATTMFNINAATETFWKAKQFNVGGTALTPSKLMQATARMKAMGVKDGFNAYLDELQFNDLSDNRDALVRYMGNSKNVEIGSEEILLNTAAGTAFLKRQMRQKQGQAYFIARGEENSCSVGSKMPGLFTSGTGQNPVSELNGKNGWEVKASGEIGPLLRQPAKMLRVYNIVSTGQASPV